MYMVAATDIDKAYTKMKQKYCTGDIIWSVVPTRKQSCSIEFLPIHSPTVMESMVATRRMANQKDFVVC